ncbi:translation initiation factor IF-3 [Candidatus Kaiserbacteria bacterium]|nr:translation initiation factor IF-3 [Candidatus Kaiserbacteria bacterium]
MRPPNKQFAGKDTRTRINQAIRAPELRVIGPEGENLGTLPLAKALKEADKYKLDLIEISPNAKPPVAKITDYGEYRYETKKKASAAKAKAHVTETKNVQVKIGTGEHDQQLKAKRIAEWLDEGHRVKVDLFLWGRYKYMEAGFLKERLDRFLKIIPVDYKIADPMKKSPKGWTATVEREGKARKASDMPKVIEQKDKKPEKYDKTEEKPENKSKKKSLDDLLDIEGGLI